MVGNRNLVTTTGASFEARGGSVLSSPLTFATYTHLRHLTISLSCNVVSSQKRQHFGYGVGRLIQLSKAICLFERQHQAIRLDANKQQYDKPKANKVRSIRSSQEVEHQTKAKPEANSIHSDEAHKSSQVDHRAKGGDQITDSLSTKSRAVSNEDYSLFKKLILVSFKDVTKMKIKISFLPKLLILGELI